MLKDAELDLASEVVTIDQHQTEKNGKGGKRRFTFRVTTGASLGAVKDMVSAPNQSIHMDGGGVVDCVRGPTQLAVAPAPANLEFTHRGVVVARVNCCCGRNSSTAHEMQGIIRFAFYFFIFLPSFSRSRVLPDENQWVMDAATAEARTEYVGVVEDAIARVRADHREAKMAKVGVVVDVCL